MYKIVMEYRGSICSFFSCGERIKNSRGKKPRVGQNFLKISVCWSIFAKHTIGKEERGRW